MTTKFLSIFVLLLCSFALSAAEVALYSLTSSNEKMPGRVAMKLLGSPQLLLTTILVSNAVAVFLLTLLGASLAMDFASQLSLNKTMAVVVEVIIISGTLIILADAVPKVIAARNPKLVIRLSLPLLLALVLVESPFVIPLNKFLSRITARRNRPTLSIDNKGLKTLSQIAGHAGVIEEQEAELLRKISDLGEKNVRGAMTPRTQIVSVSVDCGLKEIVDAFNQSEHSRLPVYTNASDNIIGVVYARDVLPLMRKRNKGRKFDTSLIMRKPIFVPESQSIENLLDTFRSNRVHIAMVVDEFGGLAGLVTLSDVVREIFGTGGEMPREGTRVVRQKDGSLLIKGGSKLEDVAAEVGGLDLDYQPEDTVSSLLINRHGSVPRVGTRLEIGKFIFEIEQATPKAILQVRLRQSDPLPVERSD